MRGNDWETWLRRTPSEREDEWGKCRGFDWEFLLRRMPSEREKEQGRTSRGKWGKKLQKLIFLKLEIMLKMDIFRQTKGQNPQTSGSF